MEILLIHGPNLNLLGKRNPEIYGSLTLKQIEDLVKEHALKLGWSVEGYQSNYEGDLIDKIQNRSADTKGILINPGAFTHYSYALHDALVDAGIPVVEVHLSDINEREEWRKVSVTAPACIKVICGKKEQGYIEGIDALINLD